MKAQPLILYASIGQGHKQAALALKQELENQGYQPSIMDTFYTISPILHNCFIKSYLSLLKISPSLWRQLYFKAEKHPLFYCMDQLGSFFIERLHRLVRDENIPFIISTHPFVTPFLTTMKKKKGCNKALYTVITDFVMHPAYLREQIDGYFTADPDSRDFAKKFNYPVERFITTGIPVTDHTISGKCKWKLRYDLELPQEKKIVIVAGGGIGLTNYEKVIRELEGLEDEIILLCMTGFNERIAERISTLKSKHEVRIIPFTDKFLHYLRASDAVISKSGGLTMAESLICETPIIVYQPVPGHEEHNAEFLEKNGAAKIVKRTESLLKTTEEVLYNQNVIKEMNRACNELKRPYAAEEIIENILKFEQKRESATH